MIGTGRVWATSAISAPSVITISTPRRSAAVDDRVGEGAPADVRLDPAEQDEIALRGGHADRQQRVRGPVDLARLALDQADRGPVDLEVVELLRVDPGDDLRVERGGDRLQRRGGRAGGVVPAGEGADQGRRAKLGRIALPDDGIHGRETIRNAAPPRRRPARAVHDRGMEAAVAISTGRRTRAQPTIAELRPGQRFEGRFACVRKDRLTARNGGAYLSLELRDRTGTLAGAACSARRTGSACASTAATRCWRAAGSSAFAGELVAELDDVAPPGARVVRPGRVPARRLSLGRGARGLPRAPAREIHDPGLRAVVERLLLAGPSASEFRRAPCTRAGHHAYLGGLLEHTVSVGTLVGELCQLHPRLDSDLLMAAALLHDVGKTREFTYGARVRAQRRGQAARPPGDRSADDRRRGGRLPAERRLALLHCVLSHHGPDGGPGRVAGGARAARGFGSAEALALYRLNALDASVKGALEHGL